MTLKLAKPTGAKLNLRKTWQPMDADAAAYITAVETADNQALEERVKIAIDNFVLGCKADGIWSAIKASCILAGARTLNGALVPLVGTAPTNFNFVSGDYNRKTGLVGNGSTKYLNSNRNNNADPQNSKHLSVYATSATTTSGVLLGSETLNTTGDSYLYRGFGPDFTSFKNNNSGATGFSLGSPHFSTGFFGCTRSSASGAQSRRQGFTDNHTLSSVTPANANLRVFGSSSLFINARLAFYSIGESLDLSLLDARVTDLINAFGAAIP